MTGPRARDAVAIRTSSAWWLLLPALLSAFALHEHPAPETYDDLVYYWSARALHENGEYAFGGFFVCDWPPGLPALLAAVLSSASLSFGAAKLIVWACFALSIWRIHALLVRTGRPFPVATTLIACLVPHAFHGSTRVMSEWPYILASTLSLEFLLSLSDRSREARRRSALGLLVGCSLAVCVLFRNAGLALGAAVLHQALSQVRLRRSRAGFLHALPELLAGAVMTLTFVLWRLAQQWHVEQGTAYRTYHGSIGFFLTFEPFRTIESITDALFGSSAILRALLGADAAVLAVSVLVVVVLAIGFWARVRRGAFDACDSYTFGMLALVSMLEVKEPRYMLPIVPFLVGYAWETGSLIGASPRWPYAARALRLAMGAWIGLLLVLTGVLLGRGNGHSYNSMLRWNAIDAEDHYLGRTLDLHRGCAWLRARVPRNEGILMQGFVPIKYAAHFCERAILYDSRRAPGDTISGCQLAPRFPQQGLALMDPQGYPLRIGAFKRPAPCRYGGAIRAEGSKLSRPAGFVRSESRKFGSVTFEVF